MAKKSTSSNKKRLVKVEAVGQAHVHSSFNNIIISLTNSTGQVISWSSAGKMGFRGSKKNTPYAAQMAAADCSKVAFDLGMRKAKVYVSGPGNGRESAIRAIHASGIEVAEIIDVTPLPHTGIDADGVQYTYSWVVDFAQVKNAAWIAVPSFIGFGALSDVKITFQASAIIPIGIMFIVTAIETVGDISACIEGGMDREATDSELSGGVICDGLGSAFAALFGVLPNTSFSQNVGLVSLTKVVNRFAISMGAIFLILCGFCPKIGALMSIMPQSVLGGAAVMMFASILISGI